MEPERLLKLVVIVILIEVSNVSNTIGVSAKKRKDTLGRRENVAW